MFNWNPTLSAGLVCLILSLLIGAVSTAKAVKDKQMNRGVILAFVLFFVGSATSVMSQITVVSRISTGEADDK